LIDGVEARRPFNRSLWSEREPTDQDIRRGLLALALFEPEDRERDYARQTMIELGALVIGAWLGVMAIFWGGVLALAALSALAILVMMIGEALGRALLALALTPRWIWRAARAGTLDPPPPPRPRTACGDDSGRYVDTAALNSAFMDRSVLKTCVSFLTPAQETAMVARRVGVHAKAIEPMVEFATLTRKDCDAGKLTMGVTTRRLLAWADLVRIGIASKQAFEGVVIAGAAAEDKTTLIMLAGQDLTLHDRIDGIARGTINPNTLPVDAKAQGQGRGRVR
jgi:CbbQ/NirQ/NorQ C-terminal